MIWIIEAARGAFILACMLVLLAFVGALS